MYRCCKNVNLFFSKLSEMSKQVIFGNIDDIEIDREIKIDLGQSNRNNQSRSTNAHASKTAVRQFLLGTKNNPASSFQPFNSGPFRPEESSYPVGFSGCKIQ
jgi:hypothetical protein